MPPPIEYNVAIFNGLRKMDSNKKINTNANCIDTISLVGAAAYFNQPLVKYGRDSINGR